MDFNKLIKERHSIRRFKDKKIPETKLNKIIEASRRAPSAGNLQAYEIIIVKDAQRKTELSHAALNQSSVKSAPVVLVFLADVVKSGSRYSTRGRTLYAVQDATIACVYAQLMAANVGLSSVWVGAFSESKVKNVIKARNMKPVALLPIGYSDEIPFITTRRGIKEFTHREELNL